MSSTLPTFSSTLYAPTAGRMLGAGLLGASVLPSALMREAAGDVEVLSVVRDVVAIVKRVTNDPAYRVVLFGSWASGMPRTRSDIDIGVQGPQRIDPVTLQAIRAACDALPTLCTIDLVDLDVLPATVQRRITVFGQALARFDEVLARPEDAIVRDACIQRFEFTFETAWKAVQAQAMAEGLYAGMMRRLQERLTERSR